MSEMPRPVRPSALRSALPLGVAAGCAALLATPEAGAADGARDNSSTTEITRLRAQGPSALAELFTRYDRLPVGAERDKLAQVIDQVARQRYATVSRLYWYTEL